jgi:hypothetical protein
MRHRAIGILAPGQVRPRRPRLLAGIPGRRPLQPRQPLLKLADPFCQRRILRCQHRDELALLRDQRITGSIQRRGGHRPPSSGIPAVNKATRGIWMPA